MNRSDGSSVLAGFAGDARNGPRIEHYPAEKTLKISMHYNGKQYIEEMTLKLAKDETEPLAKRIKLA